MAVVKNRFKSFNEAILGLSLIAIILFGIISYFMLQNLLTGFRERANNRFQMAENFLNSSINGANQIIYGLSLSLMEEKISSNNHNIINLVRNFDHKLDRRKSIPFYGLKILDHNDMVILHTSVPDKLFRVTKAESDSELLENSKKNPFELQIGKIRMGRLSHEEIIPFCMGISNNSIYVGSICSGFPVKILSAKLNAQVSTKHINAIKLFNEDTHDNLNRINNSFTLTKILGAYFKDEYLIIHQPLTCYPYLIEAEVNCYYLSKEIAVVMLLILCYLILFMSFIYYFLIINKKFYQEPLSKIQEKIDEYTAHFINKTPDFYKLHSHELCLSHLSQAINHIIDYCHTLHCNAEKTALEGPAQELRNNILHLILTEKHYCNANKETDTNTGSLYLNKLKQLINSKEQEISLNKFLDEIISYCSEYYSELRIKLIIEDASYRQFSIKHAAITEAIFTIFTSIIRIGEFDEEVILKGYFFNNTSPTISIEATLQDSLLRPLGWKLGPNYIHSGLLSIYLLAKENNFFFHIEQKDNKIIFLLEPIDNERLKSANALCRKLPLNITS